MENRLTTRTITLLLIFVVLGVYYPAIFAPLNSVDDPGMNQYLLNADTFSLRDIFFPGGSGTYYRPLLVLSFFWDKYVWGLEESFMHLDNVVFHLCNTLLLFAIARRVSRELGVKSSLPVFLAPLFFAIHPINTESVNWISGRTDLLAGFFIFLSVFLLLGESRSGIASLLAALSLLLACLAKDTAIFFLPAAILLPLFLSACGTDKASLRATLVKNIPHFLIFTAAGAGYFAFRALAFRQGDAGVRQVITHVAGSQGAGALLSIRLVLKAAGFYVKKLFIPFPLNFGIVHVSDLYIIVGVLLCITIVWLLMRRTLSGFFFIAAAAIGSSALLVPLLRMTWTPLGERYLYVPSAFFLVGVTFTLQRWAHMRHFQKIMVPVIAGIAVVAIYGTAKRGILWQDNLALFEDCRRKSPDFVPAQNEMATALYARGNNLAASAIIRSMVLPEDLNNRQYGLISKSAALVNDGDYDAARMILRQALAAPGKHEVVIIQRLLGLNGLEVMKGSATHAKFHAENVQLLSRIYAITGDTFYLYRLGQIHMFQGERALAREAFTRVAAQAPGNAYYRQAASKLSEKM